MATEEAESILKNRKGYKKVEKSVPLEAEDVKKGTLNKKIDTKDIRNLPVSLQRGKSNHKWLAMMTVLGALLLKLLNAYNEKKKNKDTFYTKNVNIFKNYSNETSFLTYTDEYDIKYPFAFEFENVTLVGSEYVKYDVEELFLQSWEDYHFDNKHVNKIDYVIESLDTKLLMFNNTQSLNHKLKFKYLVEQDLKIIKYGKEFNMANTALEGLLSSYNLFQSEILLKNAFPNGADIIKDQLLEIAERLLLLVKYEDFSGVTLDLQALLQVINSTSDHKDLEMAISALSDIFKKKFEVSKNSSIERYCELAAEHHFNNHTGDFSAFWAYMNTLKNNNTKNTKVSLPLNKKTTKKTKKRMNKLLYVDTNTEDVNFVASFCSLPTHLLLAVTKGYEQDQISKNNNLFDDVPDMKENYDYAMELVRSCYHIFMESVSSNDQKSIPEFVVFDDGNLEADDHKDLVLSKYGSFYYKPTSKNILKADKILETIYNAYQVNKSRTFQLWIFEIFQHYSTTLEGFEYDETWFSHTLKYLYLSFLNEEEGVDLREVVFTKKGHVYPIIH